MLIANPYILLQHTLFQTVNSVCFEILKKNYICGNDKSEAVSRGDLLKFQLQYIYIQYSSFGIC